MHRTHYCIEGTNNGFSIIGASKVNWLQIQMAVKGYLGFIKIVSNTRLPTNHVSFINRSTVGTLDVLLCMLEQHPLGIEANTFLSIYLMCLVRLLGNKNQLCD